MTTKDILRLGVDIQALALTGENLKVVKKKQIKVEDIVSTGIKNIVGINLLKTQSDIIGDF